MIAGVLNIENCGLCLVGGMVKEKKIELKEENQLSKCGRTQEVFNSVKYCGSRKPIGFTTEIWLRKHMRRVVGTDARLQ